MVNYRSLIVQIDCKSTGQEHTWSSNVNVSHKVAEKYVLHKLSADIRHDTSKCTYSTIWTLSSFIKYTYLLSRGFTNLVSWLTLTYVIRDVEFSAQLILSRDSWATITQILFIEARMNC